MAQQESTISAAAAAQQSGELVTIGIPPTWACPGFGYIEMGPLFSVTEAKDGQEALDACRAAFDDLKPDLRAALELAAQRIRAYHEAQLPADRDATDAVGVRLGARWRAVDAAGLYVPGGRAAYPSSLLMNDM